MASDQRPIDLEKPKLARAEANDQPQGCFLLVIRNFPAVWWIVAMDTGVLGIILHQFPFPSHWTKICSTIMFVLCFVLCCLFSAITLLQWVLFYDKVREDIKDAEEIAFQACPLIAWITITMQLQLTCADAWGNGFTMLAYALWWVELVWALIVCVTLYVYLIEVPSQETVDRLLPTAVFIPVVAIITMANAAGVIVNDSTAGHTHLSDRLAVPMIIVSFLLVGLGLSLASVVYAIYTHRLMTTGWPPSLKVPGMVLTIGPCGQGASALLQLGNAAVHNENFARYARGFFLQENAASTLRIICVVPALLLLGFAVFWMCVAYYAIITGLIRRQIHPSMFWWSTIFPVGTVVTALAGLGADMDSLAFKILATILFVFLFCIFVVDGIVTVPMTLSGELFGLPQRSNRICSNLKHVHPWAGHLRKHRLLKTEVFEKEDLYDQAHES